MYFSLLIIPVVLVILYLRKRKKPRTVGFLEPGEATVESFRFSEKTKKRYFYFDGGRIDLDKHPELSLFHVIGGKDVLVEPWKREESLYLSPGKTKIAIFDFIEGDFGAIGIPCLRTFERVMVEDEPDPVLGPLTDYKKVELRVSWNDGKRHRILPEENFIGVVKYESL